jgi:hypothetical protein
LPYGSALTSDRSRRIISASGEIFEVRHPENAMLLRTNLLIGFPEKDSFALCALSHVSAVPPLQRA